MLGFDEGPPPLGLADGASDGPRVFPFVTLIVNCPSVVFLCLSVAVTVTMVSPNGKILPLATSVVAVGFASQSSCADAVNVTIPLYGATSVVEVSIVYGSSLSSINGTGEDLSVIVVSTTAG